jgi:hypothetical protein
MGPEDNPADNDPHGECRHEIERCIECDEATGKAGRLDDSLYTDDSEGPFCESCFQKRLDERAQDQTMKNPCQDEGD